MIPYFGYARQDRKSAPRTPISAKLVANLAGSGLSVRVCGSTAEAVRGADIVTTVTADKACVVTARAMLVPRVLGSRLVFQPAKSATTFGTNANSTLNGKDWMKDVCSNPP